MKLTSLLFLFLAFNAIAVENTYNCKKLISGNSNGKAHTTAESIDFSLKIDTESEEAEVEGTMVTKTGRFENEAVDVIQAYFTDSSKFKSRGDIITITSFDRNLVMCGLTNSPCRHWESMVFNMKTKEATLEGAFSYGAYFGRVIYSLSIKFSCSSI